MQGRKTSWGKVASWYGKRVGTKGHFYHEQSILPKILSVIGQNKVGSVVDLGCGQGVLERTLPEHISYIGVDISPELVGQARKLQKRANSQFYVADASKPLKMITQVDCATCVLALQNIEEYKGVFRNFGQIVRKGGMVVIALNHPYYRIPRFSGWSVQEGSGKQIRWVSNYLEEQKIPITMNPGETRGHQKVTWSFHVPLSLYMQALTENGFVLTDLQELSSPKESEGKFAKRENTARSEIPLFMILVAKKL